MPVAYFQKSKNSLKARKDKKNLRSGKRRGQRKRKRKGAYDKSDGITHDTAAFAFRTKDILKIRSHPRLEPGSDYHYLVPVVGLEPTRCCHQRILNPSRLPIPSYRQRDCKILYTTLKRLASLFDGGKSENNRLINIPFPVEMCYDNLDFITYPMEGFRR